MAQIPVAPYPQSMAPKEPPQMQGIANQPVGAQGSSLLSEGNCDREDGAIISSLVEVPIAGNPQDQPSEP